MNPESHITLLLCLPFLGMATLSVGAVVAVAWRYADAVPFKRESRTAYWAGMAVFGPLLLVSVPLAAWVAKTVAVVGFAGPEAHADGLRVVKNDGLLSDGRYLSGFWGAALGAVLWAVLLLIGAAFASWHVYFHPKRSGADPAGGPQDAEPGTAPDS